jgi:hypothetical protein
MIGEWIAKLRKEGIFLKHQFDSHTVDTNTPGGVARVFWLNQCSRRGEEERRRELTKLSHWDNLVFDSARGAPEDFKSVSLAGEG